MKPKNDLFQLIQSMSMSEKRHFRIYSSRHIVGEQNNYIKLFETISDQKEYNEEAIKTKFKGETFIRHLPSEKNYLYYQILDALNAFNRDKTFLSRHTSNLASIEMLFQRGLFSQCRTLIKRAKKEAYLIEKFSILLLILRWETLIFIKDEDDKALNKSLWEELRIIEVLKIQTTLAQIAFNIQIRIDKGETSPSFITASEKELKKNYPDENQVSSFWTKYYFYSSVGLLSALKNDQKKRLECFRQIKSIMDEAPQFIKDLPGIYHTNSNNMVTVLCLTGNYSEAASQLKEQQNFISNYQIRNKALADIVFLNTSESQLFLLYKTSRYKDAVAVSRKIEQEIKQLDLTFSPLLYDLFFMLAVIELGNRNYKLSGKWLNKILNMEREVHLRKELPINARLLYLIVLLESNDPLFDTRVNATKRYLSQERQFLTQFKILEVIRLLGEGSLSKKRKALLKKYVGELRSEMKRSKEESLNKQYDFTEWINARIANTDF